MYKEHNIIYSYISNEMPIEVALRFINSLYGGVVPCRLIDVFAAISELKVRRYAFDLEQKANEDRYLEFLKVKQKYEKIDREDQ